MATPQLTKSSIKGRFGDILIDVRASQYLTPMPAVLIAPGFKGFKDWGMFPLFAERVARAGLTAISFNVSGSGVDDEGRFAHPERFGHNTFSAELEDYRAILTALDRGALGVPTPSSVGAVGHSRGGGLATLLAASTDRIGALVTWAAISRVGRWSPETRQAWRDRGRHDVVNTRTGEVLPLYLDTLDDLEAHADRLDIEAAARRIAIPWLIVHGEADETVPVAEANVLKEASRGAETLLVAGAGHTFGSTHPFQTMTEATDLVFGATVSFLSRHLD